MINFYKIDNLSYSSKYYLSNICLVLMVLSSITLTFFIQFKVDNLQDKLKEASVKIVTLDEEIKVLEVEWVYLTRPERVRMLSEKYLKNNGYTAFNQVKDSEKLEIYYTASLKKQQNIAMNVVQKN